MTYRFRNIALALSVTAALGLAGCGGGGSGTADVAPVEPPPTVEEMQAAEIMELQEQIAALREQLGLPADADPATGISDLMDERDRLQGMVTELQEAEEQREAERMEAEQAALAAAASRLYAGIAAPMGAVGTYATTDLIAGYNADDTAIVVQIGTDPAATAPTATLMASAEDGGSNHGWEGKIYRRTMPTGDGAYVATVYSNIETPKRGKMFGSIAPSLDPAGPYQYQLNPEGALENDNADGLTGDTTGFIPALVALTNVTRTAGVETFDFPDPNLEGETVVLVPGSYHGVSGTYSCEPGAAGTCTATVAARGFALGGEGTPAWSFTPNNASERVTDTTDDAYASYGAWLHTPAHGRAHTASAFTDEVGELTDVTGLDTLNGTATYQGGAAGYYALTSRTGGTNDVGGFSARATLDANFTDNRISGMIDQFIGSDGMPRDWEVMLMPSSVSATGAISGDPDDSAIVGDRRTQWTIGGDASAADGRWSGALRNNGTDDVPQVVTGTFYSTYGGSGAGEGRMVGGFGANKQ